MTRPWRDTDDDAAEDRHLVCSICELRITDEAHAIAKGGAHEHTFVNPGGFVHRVRCFAAASGVREQGAPAHAFSWFPGYSWQIVHCAGCDEHLGWIYRCDGDRFWGLVADRLVER